jgi:hypothetical protein
MIHSSFDTPWERIDEICDTANKTASYLNTITEFVNFVNANLENLDIEQINNIYADFVRCNEHIIEKMNKFLRSDPKLFNNLHPPCLSSTASSTSNISK